ncbi:MAG: ribosome-binding factor A [Candidatus Wildermuthbacteria bacterium RIFCSPHIGHO2_01_FULL_47_27]|uniref:Ribosome-binding factor A n=1 Tax=Candidatus Wildermuthbacteria bacterium RIFCSPHIGHO2_02_FULL_47_17 TaxID=1802452 RepID=A0A1G2R785_9BACT|nr:MAG: Ribosome-binding factor A [Parcubacteria group bacterium GW2011_GWA2_47_9]OHA64302.1 MAG: ribosome-binding factor A [Candidatus Wildermuthbacteria bacterium RIFCSPHIGHO2_01_FULL_47_27]OHA67961.1 MAG: ribosome-binding factor A [Candidatus Wildermuthbacteria bacterium RIFCSPHIGHO2_02_FULL_47_17]
MSSKRILRVNELIKKELNGIIIREIEALPDVFITITRVDCSPDLRQAKVYISVIPDSRFQKVFRQLLANVAELQHLLNLRLRMRPVPKVVFAEEKTTKDAAKIEQLLKEIKKDV